MKKILSLLLLASVLVACSTTYQLMKTKVQIHPDFEQYKYVYIIPTAPIVYGETKGHISNGEGSVSGSTNSLTVSDVILGKMMNRGYVILPELQDEFLSKTLVISCGNTGMRELDYGVYATEMTIQLRDAKTSELIASSKAEAEVDTKPNAPVIGTSTALNKALNALFYVVDNPQVRK